MNISLTYRARRLLVRGERVFFAAHAELVSPLHLIHRLIATLGRGVQYFTEHPYGSVFATLMGLTPTLQSVRR